MFLEEFYELLEYVTINFKCFLICGDFNIHINKLTDSAAVKFTDILNTFSLQQLIKSSTHKCGNILDLIIHDPNIITISDIIIDSVDKPGSDHHIIYFKLMCNITSNEKHNVSFRNFKEVVLSDFHADILNNTNQYLDEANDVDFNSCVKLFSDLYSSTVDKHAPVVNKLVNTVTRPPWMDVDFVSARKVRRSLYKKWKKSKSLESRANFEQSRAYVNVLATEKASPLLSANY